MPVALQAAFYAVVAMQSFDTKAWFWLAVYKPLTRYMEYYGAVALLLGSTWGCRSGCCGDTRRRLAACECCCGRWPAFTG